MAKQIRIFVCLLTGFITACATTPTLVTATHPPPEAATSPTSTFTPTSTSTDTPTFTNTPLQPTLTFTPVYDFTPTPTFTVEPTKPPTGDAPGALVSGSVTLPNGEGIAGAQIYYAFSAYPGSLLATANSQGQYEGFIYIPHEETVRVWAEYAGYTFKPGEGSKSWLGGEFAWHSYGGYENVSLSFIGTPQQP